MTALSADQAWIKTLTEITKHGVVTYPRGHKCYDMGHYHQVVDMRQPVVTHTPRKLSYQFMAAEAYWILSGDDKVAGISPWNKHIAQFSDDGERFFGAYGPPIQDQLSYVVNKLIVDPDSRQAALTIWRPNPPETKDVPCTVAMTFRRWRDFLDLHVFMRSSDAWLGLPYDIFNFSMLAHLTAGYVNSDPRSTLSAALVPRHLHLTTVSTHLYDRDLVSASDCMAIRPPAACRVTPVEFYLHDFWVLETLKQLRDSKPGSDLRWWES